MKEIQYDRKKAVEYAQKWAYKRNPNYYNYDAIGGDCTNFVSQCIFAGSQVMNYIIGMLIKNLLLGQELNFCINF